MISPEDLAKEIFEIQQRELYGELADAWADAPIDIQKRLTRIAQALLAKFDVAEKREPDEYREGDIDKFFGCAPGAYRAE